MLRELLAGPLASKAPAAPDDRPVRGGAGPAPPPAAGRPRSNGPTGQIGGRAMLAPGRVAQRPARQAARASGAATAARPTTAAAGDGADRRTPDSTAPIPARRSARPPTGELPTAPWATPAARPPAVGSGARRRRSRRGRRAACWPRGPRRWPRGRPARRRPAALAVLVLLGRWRSPLIRGGDDPTAPPPAAGAAGHQRARRRLRRRRTYDDRGVDGQRARRAGSASGAAASGSTTSTRTTADRKVRILVENGQRRPGEVPAGAPRTGLQQNATGNCAAAVQPGRPDATASSAGQPAAELEYTCGSGDDDAARHLAARWSATARRTRSS